MKNEVLKAIIEKWENDAKQPKNENGAEDAKTPNAVARGVREGRKDCAEQLRALIVLVG